jgi:hypothetical protein
LTKILASKEALPRIIFWPALDFRGFACLQAVNRLLANWRLFSFCGANMASARDADGIRKRLFF